MVIDNNLSLLHFSSHNSKPFLLLISRNINKKFNIKTTNYIHIEGAISGKLYFEEPPIENNLGFRIKKEELINIDTNIIDKLPEVLFFI